MQKKPNLIFILNDHQAFYGHGMNGGVKPLRPNFEKFAADGMDFTNAYCVTPMCGPARRSLLTGLYPHTNGQVHNENDPPYNHEVYLDRLATDGGYKNYYYGKWHAGPGCAYDHNCEGLSETSYGNPYNTKEYANYLQRKGLPKAKHLIERKFECAAYIDQHYFPKLADGVLYECEDKWCGEHAIGITTTPKETHEAFFLASLACDKLEELAKNKSDEPFALRVDFWGPHQPFFPTQEFIDLYNPADIQEYPSFRNDLHDKPNTLHTEATMPMGDGVDIVIPNPIPWEEWQTILTRCYAHGSMLDAAGGVILDKIRELGLDEDTIIIWSTDHGDAIACQGGHFDKDSHMAQEVERIPMALNWKDHIAPNQTCDKLVFTCDIPVTLMSAAGLTFGNPVDGANLLDLALHTQAEQDWRTSLLCETYGHGYGTTIIGRMVVEGDYKYCCTEDDLDELYNLKEDPYEMKNLAILPEYNELKEKMRTLLRRKQAESFDPIPLEQLLPKE